MSEYAASTDYARVVRSFQRLWKKVRRMLCAPSEHRCITCDCELSCDGRFCIWAESNKRYEKYQKALRRLQRMKKERGG